jgi:hypothetical protein
MKLAQPLHVSSEYNNKHFCSSKEYKYHYTHINEENVCPTDHSRPTLVLQDLIEISREKSLIELRNFVAV